MRFHNASRCWLVVLAAALAGCNGETEQSALDEARALRDGTTSPGGPELPEGWVIYTSPQKDFSIAAPRMPIEIATEKLYQENLRSFLFTVDGARLVVDVFYDRTGEAAVDVVETMRNGLAQRSPPGSFREVTAGDLHGIEFRTKDPRGEVVNRVYCTPDKTRSFDLYVQKDASGGVPEEQVKAFLESFTPLK